MNLNRKIFVTTLTLFVGLLMNFYSFGQQVVKSMPASSDEYFVTLQVHFERVQDKDSKLVKNFLKDLEVKWTTGYFSDDIKQKIYVTSNKMLDNKMRAMPFFYDYFIGLITMIDKGYDPAAISKWMESVDFILKTKPSRDFTAYLENSLALFNKQFIFSNDIIQWKITGDWSMEVDTSIRVLFSNTDLICYTKKDSSNIYNTQGVFIAAENLWIGKGGRIDWQRAGFTPDEVFATLNNYRIEMKMSKFEADSVEFQNKRYFSQPLLGRLEEQVLASRTGEKALYPSFTSYTKQWEIPEIFKDVDFSGGFKIEGARLIGVGDSKNPVVLTFKRNGKPFIYLKSNSFSIDTDRIRSQFASISMHYGQDSIYHSGLRMNYSDQTRELSLIRDDKGLRADPFSNTYHQLDMFVEAFYWKMDENYIDFDMIKGMNKRPAFFTSNNQYSLTHFEEIIGMDSEHPLSLLNKYVKENHSDVIYILDYTKYVKKPYEQVKLQLLSLAHEGFVMYDAENDLVIVKDRTAFYINARTGKVDYDVILFRSDSTKLTNAKLRLDSFDLRINGVQSIILSDSQNLVIEPGDKKIADDEYIIVGKNRDFRFNGTVTAGRFSFKANNCVFDYNAFKLDMPQIDSLWFWVEGGPLPTGGYERIPVKTALIDLAGDILIDHPANKSGLKPYKEYPVFNSKKDSYAYYDHPSIELGVYSRSRFYYRISPFVLHALDDIKTEEISFDGYLFSGGIFPDIAEPLRVMPDYSLGFVKQTPTSGLPAYGGKGNFFNTVNLSNRGLRGDGNLDYLTSKTIAKDYIFYLDSMNVHADAFNIQASTAGIEYPRVNAINVYEHWMPYRDEMLIFTKKDNMSMYDEETNLAGMLSLKPTGLTGSGTLNYKVAKMISNKYKFKNLTYQADTVNFIDDGWTLTNFQANADYKERKVLFSSNGGTSVVEFPQNLYICYMDEATWYMDRDETTYSKKDATLPEELVGKTRKELADIEIKGSEFFSVHPGQDSLTFKSARASFNSKRKEIRAEGVIFLNVADAAIFPGDGIVTILQNAEMIPLENAGILANTTTKYHDIDNAKVKVNGKNDYMASGNYKYIDKEKKAQNIFFNNISVDTTLQTIASGTILKENDFTLNPAFKFYGDAHLLASRKELEFDGGFKINTGCINGDHWVAFKSIVEPENVFIPIPVQPRVPDISNTRKYAGIANSQTKREVYSIFLQDKVDYFDSVILSANGFITFDEGSNEYRISSKEKLLQLSRPDNYLSFNANSCKTFGEGKINIDVRTEDFVIQSYGNAVEKSGDADFVMASAFDFHFSEKALEEIINLFKANEYSGYDLNSDFYAKVAGGYMGIEAADKYLTRIALGQQKKSPDQLVHTLFFNEMKLKWQPATNSYISQGKINIGGILKGRINGEIVGIVEFRKIRSGDEVNIYFEIGGEWFYFNYQSNLLKAFSSLGKFNDLIIEDVTGKGDKNKVKEEKDDGKKSAFRYNIGDTKKKDDFLTRVKPYN